MVTGTSAACRFRILSCCFLLCGTVAIADHVYLLSGETCAGRIGFVDRYTIKIVSENGVRFVPIAALAPEEAGRLDRYDRSRDGRFWYERREALRDLQARLAAASGSSGIELSDLREAFLAVDQRRFLINEYEAELARTAHDANNWRQAAAEERRRYLAWLDEQDSAESARRIAARIKQLDAAMANADKNREKLVATRAAFRHGSPNWSLFQLAIKQIDLRMERLSDEAEALRRKINTPGPAGSKSPP